jgi:hypothetical protein
VATTRLLAEIRDQGYTGSANLLVRYLNQRRADAQRPAPSPRRLVAWLITRPDKLTAHQRIHLDDLLAACPHLAAGLTLPHSNGPIEGANTKVKYLKRQMYGRAGFPYYDNESSSHSHSATTTVSAQIQSGTVERVVRSLGDVKKDGQVVIGQVADVMRSSDGEVAERGFRLSEVEVALGFDARGKLAFIAEAGVEATVTVRFQRRLTPAARPMIGRRGGTDLPSPGDDAIRQLAGMSSDNFLPAGTGRMRLPTLLLSGRRRLRQRLETRMVTSGFLMLLSGRARGMGSSSDGRYRTASQAVAGGGLFLSRDRSLRR